VHWLIRPATTLRGALSVPGDKSISHRALIHAALADGTSRIRGCLRAGVTEAMIRCVRALDVGVEIDRDASLVVQGGDIRSPADILDCGNSGATMRMLLGALAGQVDVEATLSGSAGLRRRPMRRAIDPLRQMGAAIVEDAPPITVHGRALRGIDVALPVASAQVKAALLLAALRADGPTTIREPGPSRDHSERLLRALGVCVVSRDGAVTLDPIDGLLPPFELSVPGDLSSAAFLIAAATLTPNSEVTIQSVGVNPTRTGILDELTAMGAWIEIASGREAGYELTADLTIRSSQLRGITVEGDNVVRMIDEFPVFAVVATQAAGETIVRDARELRVKESDRIGALVSELRRLGAHIEARADGFVIAGPTRLRGAVVDSHGDHRLAMALAVAGLRAEGETIIQNVDVYRESYPDFVEVLRRLGGHIE